MNKNRKMLVIKPDYPHMPIGMAYVLGVLEREGINFDFHDMYVDSSKCLSDVISQDAYFAIATGGLVGNYNEIKQIAFESKKIHPNVPLILGGGIGKDISSKRLFEWLPIDYVVLGEAETALPGLLNVILARNQEIDECCGLIYRNPENGEIIKKAVKKLDLEKEDPMPAYKYIDVKFYLDSWEHLNWGKKRTMPVLTGRGCKSCCSFCSPTLGRFRKRKCENVLKEIEEYNRLYDPEAFVFINEILYETDDQIIEFCKRYRKLPNYKPWMCLLRADIEPRVFPVMQESGCIAINMGIESSVDRVLANMKKKITRAQILPAVRTLQKTDLSVEFSFMLGNEGETEEEIRATIDFLIDEKVIYHTLVLTVAYPGTLIYKNALLHGRIDNEEEYVKNLIFGLGPTVPNLCSMNYLNISAMPDKIFWKAIFNQYRRYAVFLYKTGMAKDLQKEIDLDYDLIRFSGLCPKCGKSIKVQGVYSENFLNIKEKCPGCSITVYFNPFALPEYKEQYNNLRKAIDGADSIVINGTNGNAYALYLYDILSIPAEKIVGFIEPRNYLPNNPFFQFRRINRENIKQLKPQLIVNARYPANDQYLNLYTETKHLGKFSNSLEQLPKNATICIYGTGSVAKIFFEFIVYDREDINIECFIDNCNAGIVFGKKIIKFDDFVKRNTQYDYIVVASPEYVEIYRLLLDNNITKIICLRETTSALEVIDMNKIL